MTGSLLELVAVLIIVGVLVWAIDAMPAIDTTFKQIAKIVLIVALVIYAVLTILSLVGGHALVWR